MTLTRHRQVWIDELEAHRHWPLPTAVLWVAFRDLDLLADWLMPDGAHAALIPTGTGALAMAALIDEQAQAMQAAEVLPFAALRVALKKGTVKAVGEWRRVGSWSAYDEPGWEVRPEAWQDMALIDMLTGDGRGPRLVLAPDDWQPKRRTEDPPVGAFSNIVINRATLQTIFPAGGVATTTAALPHEPWHPLEKESAARWIVRNDVRIEMKSREAKRGGPGSSRTLGEVAAGMWNEARPNDTRKPRTFADKLAG